VLCELCGEGGVFCEVKVVDILEVVDWFGIFEGYVECGCWILYL